MKIGPPPQVIVVKIAADGESNLKIVWPNPFGDGKDYVYCVQIDPLLEHAHTIRKLLEKLVKSETEQGGAVTARMLFDLAQAGYELYLGLFGATSDIGVADEVRERLRAATAELAARGRRYLIMFKVEDTLHIPWGLIYDSKPERVEGAPTPADYPDFWCIKYDASALNKKITLPALQAIPDDYFRILSVVNRSALMKAARLLPKEERLSLWDTVRWITTAFEFREPIFHKERLFELWRSNRDKVNFLCFYGHANETMLSLGPGPEQNLPLNDFFTKLMRSEATPEKPGCVVFLNGCLTAVGRNNKGFLQATGREGFCGFIGTETKVPDLFALRFGIEFVTTFLNKEQRVYEIMRALREKYWPLGLSYSTCCYPLKYIENSAARRAAVSGGYAPAPPSLPRPGGPTAST